MGGNMEIGTSVLAHRQRMEKYGVDRGEKGKAQTALEVPRIYRGPGLCVLSVLQVRCVRRDSGTGMGTGNNNGKMTSGVRG